MKVRKIQFCGTGAYALQEVLEAFCKPFPSLASLPDNSAAVLNFLYTAGKESGEEIQAALDADSADGEWPGCVFLSIKRGPLADMVEELVIQPYVGDRVLIVRDTRTALVWSEWFAICDYTARPSESAASEALELAKTCRRDGNGTAANIDLINSVTYEQELVNA